MCLICCEFVSVLKEYNVKRHYEKNHESFQKLYPLGSSLRSSKVESLKAAYKKGNLILKQVVSQPERYTVASLKAVWLPTKKKRPFTDSETLKECMIVILNEVISDEKVKSKVVASVQQVPMSDTTTSRRVTAIGENLFDKICQHLRSVDVMSLAVDESTDATDVAQLSLFVRYSNEECSRFVEELLALIPMKGHTTGDDYFKAIKSFFDENKLELKQICFFFNERGERWFHHAIQNSDTQIASVALHYSPSGLMRQTFWPLQGHYGHCDENSQFGQSKVQPSASIIPCFVAE